MWLLSILPNVVIHILLISGIIGIIVSLVLNLVPFIAKYRAAIQLISSVIILTMSWLEGGIAMNTQHELEALKTKVKIADLEKQVAESEKKAAEANGRIEVVYRDKVQVVKDVQVVIRDKIKDVSFNIDSQCKITSDTVNILNAAATLSTGTKR